MRAFSNTPRAALSGVLLLVSLAAVAIAAAAAVPLALDHSFGSAGVVTGGVARSDYREAAGLAVEDTGKVLVAGAGEGGAAVVRYLPDGQLDPSYGEGGIAHLATVGVTSGASVEAVRGINALAVDGAGEALVLWQGTKLTRLTPAGALDSSFGSGGTATLGRFRFNSLTTLTDGSILLAGYGYGSPYMVAAKVRPDGSLDAAFGSGGYAAVAIGPRETNAAARRIAVRTNGRIVLAGFSHGRPALVQLLVDGRPDLSFGNRGRAVAPSSLRGEATALSLGGKGRTLIGCRCSRSRSKASLLALLRYTAAGKIDPGFSNATLRRSAPKRLRPDFLLRTGGEIVVVGTGVGPSIRLFDGHGRPAASNSGVPGVPHDRVFGVFAALQDGNPLVAWTPKHSAGQAELRLERLVLAPAG